MIRVLILLLVLVCARIVPAQTFKADVNPLIESSCIECHDATTETGLNFEKLDHDLTNPEMFRQWEKIFNRARRGEMPPKSEPRPKKRQLAKALVLHDFGCHGDSAQGCSKLMSELGDVRRVIGR